MQAKSSPLYLEAPAKQESKRHEENVCAADVRARSANFPNSRLEYCKKIYTVDVANKN